MKFKAALLVCAIGTIGLGALTGCGQSQTPVASNSPETTSTASAPASPSAPASATTTASAQGTYAPLSEVVTKTETAVKANDFSKAQQEFDQFEGAWQQVEDGVKEKAPTTYDSIEQDMDQVTAALKSSQSDKALSALQTMGEHIQKIPS